MDCVLLDISATGLKLISSENLPLDEILCVEAEDHLALADVRYAQPRGDKFTIGCERIHVLNKIAQPQDKDKAEQFRVLIEDYRNWIRHGIATPRPDANRAEVAELDRKILERCGPEPPPPSEPPASTPQSHAHPNGGTYATREQLLEAAAAWVVEDWGKVPASPQDGHATKSEILDRLSYYLAEKLHARTGPADVEIHKPHVPEHKIPQKLTRRRWRVLVGLGVAAVLGWGLSGLFWSLGSSGATGHLPTSLSSMLSTKSDPAPAPVSSIRHARIMVVEPTWLVATTDGNRLFNKKLSTNDVREIEFSDKAVLRVGNAKGVEIILDGKPIGPIGGRGQIRVVELSANGFRLLPVN